MNTITIMNAIMIYLILGLMVSTLTTVGIARNPRIKPEIVVLTFVLMILFWFPVYFYGFIQIIKGNRKNNE